MHNELKRESDRRARTGSITGRAVILPAIPLQWAWVTFDDCAWDLTVGHVGPMKDRYVASGIPFLRSLNIKPNQIDWQSKTVFIDKNFHAELSKSRLRPGELASPVSQRWCLRVSLLLTAPIWSSDGLFVR